MFYYCIHFIFIIFIGVYVERNLEIIWRELWVHLILNMMRGFDVDCIHLCLWNILCCWGCELIILLECIQKGCCIMLLIVFLLFIYHFCITIIGIKSFHLHFFSILLEFLVMDLFEKIYLSRILLLKVLLYQKDLFLWEYLLLLPYLYRHFSSIFSYFTIFWYLSDVKSQHLSTHFYLLFSYSSYIMLLHPLILELMVHKFMDCWHS